MNLEERENILREVKKTVSDGIDLKRDIPDEEIRELITRVVFDKSKQTYMNVTEKKEIVESVFNAMRRLDILQPLIEDKTVTEIMMNGPDAIFIEKNGKVSQLEARFESREKLEDVIQSIVSKVNRT